MEPVAEFTKLGWAFSGRVKSNQILPGWISQFGRLANRTFFTFVRMSQERKQTKEMDPGGLTTSPSDDYLHGRNIPKLQLPKRQCKPRYFTLP